MNDLDNLIAGFAGGSLAGFIVVFGVIGLIRHDLKNIRMQVSALWAEIKGGHDD
jgi:biotin transporter BioY